MIPGEGFQGSHFNILVREIANSDLLVERMSEEEVKRVAKILKDWLDERIKAGKINGWWGADDDLPIDKRYDNEPLLSQEDLEELVCWFEVCAENGFAVGGCF